MASVASPNIPQPEQQRQRQEQADREQGERRITRARLVQRLVENDGDLPEFMRDLIHTQAVVVAGTEAAAFLIEPSQQGGGAGGHRPELRTVAHERPDNVEEGVRRQAILAFREIVQQCLDKDKDGALRVGPAQDAESDAQFCLVTILRQEDRPVAATAVITRCRDEGRALQRLNTMQLVAGYFELFLLRRQTEQTRQTARTHQDVFQFASTVATAENFHASAAGLCNDLAARAGATRAAIGWVKGLAGDRVKLQAISHTEEFDKKQELSVQIARAMEECLDQDEFVQFDPAGQSTDNVTREAMALSQMEGGNRVASVPLRKGDRVVGVLTLEFPPEKPGGPAESTMVAVAAELLAPQLYDRYQNDRNLAVKAGISARDTTKKVFGLRQHTLAKLLILSAAALIAFLVLYRPMYAVSAPFEFAPVDQRVVDSPYDGQIVNALVEEGDPVTAGQDLVVLDTEELEGRLYEVETQARAARARAQALFAGRDDDPTALVQARSAGFDADALDAEAANLRRQIERSTVRSPIDGVVLSVEGQADLRERVGNVVRTGDPLVIVGDPDDLLVEARVADRDVEDVTVGGLGTLATSARPGEKVPVEVVKLVPAAAADQSSAANAFTVVCRPLEENPDWRVKGTGEVRLDVEPRSLAWQWTHRLVDWVRLKLWL